MCMSSVYTTLNKNNIGVGYKVFKQEDTGLFGPYYNHRFDKPYLLNRWYKSSGKEFYITENKALKYKLGFHIFTDINDAMAYRTKIIWKSDVVCKVHFKEILSFGYDTGPCLTAKWMKILHRVKV